MRGSRVKGIRRFLISNNIYTLKLFKKMKRDWAKGCKQVRGYRYGGS